jgi:hypothetical protein
LNFGLHAVGYYLSASALLSLVAVYLTHETQHLDRDSKS